MKHNGSQFQQTLKDTVTLNGVGIHSGRPARLTMKPGRPNEGIVFVRTDIDGQPRIAAHYKNVSNTQMATTLDRDLVSVGTVEHVLAALQGMGVDNAVLEINGPEVPIMDGSSLAFAQAIAQVGLMSQLQTRPYLMLKRKVELKLAEKWAVAEPCARLEIRASIDWDHPSIGFQEFHYVEGQTNFSALANARTFGFLREVEMLKSLGLARGGSLDNAVVVGMDKIHNKEKSLRWPDEFVRHKTLDLIGDLYLLGARLEAKITANRVGHGYNVNVVKQIASAFDGSAN
jgi:UDP-3-O-[3-hydroxymyristoyl] N-acetylglucosamine deacetylase